MDMRDRIKEGLGDKIKEWQDQSARRIYFSIDKSDIYRVVDFLFKELGLRFSTATCVDTPHGLEILYHFSFDKAGEFYSVRTLIEDKNNPGIDSIARQFAHCVAKAFQGKSKTDKQSKLKEVIDLIHQFRKL